MFSISSLIVSDNVHLDATSSVEILRAAIWYSEFVDGFFAYETATFSEPQSFRAAPLASNSVSKSVIEDVTRYHSISKLYIQYILDP